MAGWQKEAEVSSDAGGETRETARLMPSIIPCSCIAPALTLAWTQPQTARTPSLLPRISSNCHVAFPAPAACPEPKHVDGSDGVKVAGAAAGLAVSGALGCRVWLVCG